MTRAQLILAFLKSKFKNFFNKTEVSTVDETPEKNEIDVVRNVTGHDVVYYIPGDMKGLKVILLSENGSFKNEYVLTDFIRINPGERLRLKVLK